MPLYRQLSDSILVLAYRNLISDMLCAIMGRSGNFYERVRENWKSQGILKLQFGRHPDKFSFRIIVVHCCVEVHDAMSVALADVCFI